MGVIGLALFLLMAARFLPRRKPSGKFGSDRPILRCQIFAAFTRAIGSSSKPKAST